MGRIKNGIFHFLHHFFQLFNFSEDGKLNPKDVVDTSSNSGVDVPLLAGDLSNTVPLLLMKIPALLLEATHNIIPHQHQLRVTYGLLQLLVNLHQGVFFLFQSVSSFFEQFAMLLVHLTNFLLPFFFLALQGEAQLVHNGAGQGLKVILHHPVSDHYPCKTSTKGSTGS